TRFRAPMTIDFPAPVSPVRMFKPGSSSSVRSATTARFLMRNALSIADFVRVKFCLYATLGKYVFCGFGLGNLARSACDWRGISAGLPRESEEPSDPPV